MLLRFTSSSSSIARQPLLPWTNEDAAFTSARFFGVFDGVSQAPSSRAFSRCVADSTRAQLLEAERDGYGDEPWPGQAQSVLRRAASAASKIDGAATACLLRLDAERQRCAIYNLGDSGFLLLSPVNSRSGGGITFRVSARSSPRIHREGSPYQLAGGTSLYSDSPSSGAAAAHALQPGCIALLHTDGLLDNLGLEEVEACCARTARKGGGAAIAKALAEEAKRAGKRADDITVVAITVD